MTARRVRVALVPFVLLSLAFVIAGCSSSSSAKAVAPDPPEGVSAIASNVSAKVSFSPPADDGGSAITTYTTACAPKEGPTNGAQAKASPITVPGLAAGQTYSCTVLATNAVGTSEPSEPSNSFETMGVPSAPSAAGAVPYGSGIAKVTWNAPASDGGSPITGYVITPYQGKVAQPVRTFNSTNTTQQLSGLPNGKAYTFAIAARSDVGTSTLSAKAGVITIGAPGQPGNVKGAKSGTNSIRVTFTVPSNNGATITSYTAACRATSGSNANSITGMGTQITLSQRSLNVPNLAVGTYTCTVKAANSRGVGVLSTPSPTVTL